MKHRARWIALAAGVVVTVFAVVLATQVGTDPRADANRSHLLGANAPSVDLPTLDGGRLRSSSRPEASYGGQGQSSRSLDEADERG